MLLLNTMDLSVTNYYFFQTTFSKKILDQKHSSVRWRRI